MLEFGRGIFTACVISTFILLLVSFYPIGNDEFTLQTATPVVKQNDSTIQDKEKIKSIIGNIDIDQTINKIILENEDTMDVYMNLLDDPSDYGLMDSYKLSDAVFRDFSQINAIRFYMYKNNKPILLVNTNKTTFFNESKNLNASGEYFKNIQKVFSYTLIQE
ncbi:hypothetical protein BHU72_03775 [Desulfuribacillus stibiiarsenatis]|uniref:DUF4825 domain-containing protein n=1 Tax=Desulfuribacillus stibiiarsenatis TaxID=1390249 RepID=A0A1E5L6W4_9FIRM|nr:hypothetical protein [Desulfuribacillus stibiiarsenatis]OEH85902.1 hypothetical protein BHU72_03775 [Desulfuribacillus stibiiarsenatis]